MASKTTLGLLNDVSMSAYTQDVSYGFPLAVMGESEPQFFTRPIAVPGGVAGPMQISASASGIVPSFRVTQTNPLGTTPLQTVNAFEVISNATIADVATGLTVTSGSGLVSIVANATVGSTAASLTLGAYGTGGINMYTNGGAGADMGFTTPGVLTLKGAPKSGYVEIPPLSGLKYSTPYDATTLLPSNKYFWNGIVGDPSAWWGVPICKNQSGATEITLWDGQHAIQQAITSVKNPNGTGVQLAELDNQVMLVPSWARSFMVYSSFAAATGGTIILFGAVVPGTVLGGAGEINIQLTGCSPGSALLIMPSSADSCYNQDPAGKPWYAQDASLAPWTNFNVSGNTNAPQDPSMVRIL
jgi:hypothetical protein